MNINKTFPNVCFQSCHICACFKKIIPASTIYFMLKVNQSIATTCDFWLYLIPAVFYSFHIPYLEVNCDYHICLYLSWTVTRPRGLKSKGNLDAFTLKLLLYGLHFSFTLRIDYHGFLAMSTLVAWIKKDFWYHLVYNMRMK